MEARPVNCIVDFSHLMQVLKEGILIKTRLDAILRRRIWMDAEAVSADRKIRQGCSAVTTSRESKLLALDAKETWMVNLRLLRIVYKGTKPHKLVPERVWGSPLDHRLEHFQLTRPVTYAI
jgi:hypothetical protein